MHTNDTELMALKNLGMASVNILHAIGIHNYAELADIGAVKAYCKIKARDIQVSKVMLYAIEGALLDVHWNDISIQRKTQLVEEVEQQLRTTTQ